MLIFDEVVTGFRFAYGGAQEMTGVTPDLCTLGKVIGGGYPLAAIAGREDIMRHFDKKAVGAEQWLMMVGTLSGNPVATIAGIKTLEILRRPDTYLKLRKNGERVIEMFERILNEADIPHRVVGNPAVFNVIFVNQDVHDYCDMLVADSERGGKFFLALRENGILKSSTKTYISLALAEQDFELTEEAIRRAAMAVAEN